ncbi:MAG: hypothetical protein ACPGWR_03600 [Ardenticatenaceae bacterium]
MMPPRKLFEDGTRLVECVVVKRMVPLFPTRLTDGATDFRPSGAEEG